MKQVNVLLIILILAFFTFGVGFLWFVRTMTPETIALNQETAKLNAQKELEEIKLARQEQALEAKITLNRLNTPIFCRYYCV